MNVNEIFQSLQGEGPDTGLPAVFIRLQGCNLACSWCDTKYSWGSNGRVLSVDDVIDEAVVKSLPKFAVITGGEPLVQEKEVGQLVEKLQNLNFRVAIETNGTISMPGWWRRVTWDIDCKCPSSGVKEAFNESWLTAGWTNRLKFVVADEKDLSFVESKLSRIQGSTFPPTLLVSPMIDVIKGGVEVGSWEDTWLQRVWRFCVLNNLRYSLQVHKIVFGNRRGV